MTLSCPLTLAGLLFPDPPLVQEPLVSIRQGFLHGPGSIAQLSVCLGMTVMTVRCQGINGIARIERDSSEDFVVEFGQRSSEADKPEWQVGPDGWVAGDGFEHVQKFPYGVIAIGQDEARPGSAFVTAGDDAFGRITDIGKIISSGHAGGQPVVGNIFNEDGHMAVAVIIGPDKARGEDHVDGQSPIPGCQDAGRGIASALLLA